MAPSVADLESHLGRALAREDIVAPGPARAALAMLGRGDWAPAAGDALPPAWHMFYCLATEPAGELGRDGLPRADEVIPELPLPRRMFAGLRMRFHAPLWIGDRVRLESELKALERKRGRTGELIVATVANRLLRDGGELAVEEEHDIVAREAVAAGAASPMPAAQAAPGDAPWRESIAIDAVMLFRFSALVFNAHRIHYDRAHATRVEGYRGLVVHGPLHLILLLELLRRHAPERAIASLAMRVRAPLFDDAPVALAGRPSAGGAGAELWTATPDCTVAAEVAVAFAGARA